MAAVQKMDGFQDGNGKRDPNEDDEDEGCR